MQSHPHLLLHLCRPMQVQQRLQSRRLGAMHRLLPDALAPSLALQVLFNAAEPRVYRRLSGHREVCVRSPRHLRSLLSEGSCSLVVRRLQRADEGARTMLHLLLPLQPQQLGTVEVLLRIAPRPTLLQRTAAARMDEVFRCMRQVQQRRVTRCRCQL